MTDLVGKRIVLTGAARGLGREMSLAFLNAGARVLLTATDRAALEEVRTMSGAGADRASVHVADLRDDAAVDGIVEAAHEALGGVDVLINNAGVGSWAYREDYVENPIRFWMVTDADRRRFVEVNMLAPLRLATLVAPEMIERGWGRIVNVTTSLSTMLLAGQMLYGAPKAGLEAATAIMAGDLTGTGVTANVMTAGGAANTRLVAAWNWPAESLIPADCLVGPALWLASEASDGVSGRRFIGKDWDRQLPPEQAAQTAGAPVAWTGFGQQAQAPSATTR
jgi:3-oxoacyl-[acyl-carrier protein] reductase